MNAPVPILRGSKQHDLFALTAERLVYDDAVEMTLLSLAEHCAWSTNVGGPCSECTADQERDWLQDAARSLTDKAAEKHQDEIIALRARAIAAEADSSALRARIGELEEILAFYADDQNYRLNGPLDPNSGRFEGSTHAQAALAKMPDHLRKAEEQKP